MNIVSVSWGDHLTFGEGDGSLATPDAVARRVQAWRNEIDASVLHWRLLRTREDVAMRKSARTLFNYSLSYLFIVFFAFMTDNLLTRFGGLGA